MLRSIKHYFFQRYNNKLPTLQNMEIYNVNNSFQSENHEKTLFYRNSPNRTSWSGRLVGLVGSVGRVGRVDQLSQKVPQFDQFPQVGVSQDKTYVA